MGRREVLPSAGKRWTLHAEGGSCEMFRLAMWLEDMVVSSGSCTERGLTVVRMITLRSEVNLGDIKKNPTTQLTLNELPQIFLTQNTLSVVTPVLVGFFVKHYPYPDKPEAFGGYIETFISSRDENMEYQID
jgi:hypothetical protein